jgi:AAA+ ATPase superfamily predicted ATPase
MLIGREEEQKRLLKLIDSEYSEFVAVYGRRRVGKTFLIRETFQYRFTFQHAGIYQGKKPEQLKAFHNSIKDAGLKNISVPKTWLDAFEQLKDVIRQSTEKKKIIFIDELSWLDTPKSDLIMALESFWNGWASARKDVVLIVCSSVTSWMLNKVIHNKGGLYNRLTERIFLEPFSLKQCEEYVEKNGLIMTRYEIIETYMILGGVPYYWKFLDKSLSLPQNIDRMFFAKNAELKDEFAHLFSSLFRYPEEYIKIIHALATKNNGLTRSEIINATGISGSGSLSTKLEELEKCGFLRSYNAFGKRSKDSVFQLIDPFTIFCIRFLSGKPKDGKFWINQLDTPKVNAWSGFAFERVCFWHTENIKKALGITGVLTDICSWSCKADEDKGLFGSQIDMVIVRKDRVINLLEMKFSSAEYSIDKATYESLMRKKSDFLRETGTRSSVHITMVTPFGISRNKYSGEIQSEITAEDLFD